MTNQVLHCGEREEMTSSCCDSEFMVKSWNAKWLSKNDQAVSIVNQAKPAGVIEFYFEMMVIDNKFKPFR
jgi:hypothetical protein